MTIMRHDWAGPSLDKTLLAFTPTNWSELQKMTMIAGEDADFADDESRLILIAGGGRYWR